MLITEKILGDIGGWQAMKTARLLVSVNSVEINTRDGDTFRGTVREGKRKFAVSLVVQGPTKADCRCSCFDAQRGLVCAHAIAVALATISPSVPAVAAKPIAQAGAPAPKRAAVEVPRGTFEVFLPAQRLEAFVGTHGQLPVFLQYTAGGTETDAVSRWLATQDIPPRSGPLSLDAETAGDFFTALMGHPRVWDGKPGSPPNQRRQITIGNEPDRFAIYVSLESAGAVRFETGGSQGAGLAKSHSENADGTSQVPLLVAGARWIFQPETLTLMPLPSAGAEVTKLIRDCLDKTSGGVVRDLHWLASQLDEIESAVNLQTDEALSHLRLVPAEPRFIIELDGSPRQAMAQVSAEVGTAKLRMPSGNAPANTLYPVRESADRLTFFKRNTAAESRLTQEFERAGFVAEQGFWILKGEREVTVFFATMLPVWQRRHEVVFGEKWRATFRGWSRIAPIMRSGVGGSLPPGVGWQSTTPSRGWLDMEFSYEAPDGFRVPRNEIMRLLRSKQSTVRGQAGKVYVLDSEGCDDFESLLAESGGRLGAEGKLALATESGHIFGDFFDPVHRPPVIKLPDLAEVRARLGDLAPRLRDYQIEGVRWLIGAAESGRGALLADDMGLGKTVQVIGLLRWLADKSAGRDAIPSGESPRGLRALVVCPTSLIHNWAEELERFSVEINVKIIHGLDRELIDNNLHQNYVFITSYNLLVNDLNWHSSINYGSVIVDEASYIRNPDTAVSKAVRSLRVPVRVGLSGTPVENSVQDLWSLMSFVQPGILGDRKDFQERYTKPLAKTSDGDEAGKLLRRLRARLGPFVLRRTKKEVVRDLPDKIEKVILCDLSPEQKEVYRRLLEEGQAEIREARRRNPGSARMTMFTVLLRLRQACNDLRLLGLGAPPFPAAASSNLAAENGGAPRDAPSENLGGKWEPLANIVHDALGGGHKVLIFSQFTEMLRLLRDWLVGQGIGHSYLDGGTRNRRGEVSAFQTDPARPVFLISLKAGGYGLNLTAADHVILVEPWWNPAVEAQAIDRAHRIGQASVVTASRLIARGTVEERILKLQATKRQIMASAVEDDPLTLPGLTEDDLESLLED